MPLRILTPGNLQPGYGADPHPSGKIPRGVATKQLGGYSLLSLLRLLLVVALFLKS